MQEGEISARTETRRGQRVARRLFQDQDQDQDRDLYHNRDDNNEQGSGPPIRPYAAVEDNLANRLSEEARRDLANAKQRWNFDFENERPLPGRWDWRKVGDCQKNGENISGKNEEFENEEEETEGEDWDDENTDQREKSETEANEKTELSTKRGKY